MKTRSKDWYGLKMMTFGVLAIYRLISFLELEQEYEECKKIQEMLSENGFEGRLTNELLEDVVKHHSGEWSRDQVIESSRYYSEVLINDLYEQHVVFERFPEILKEDRV